MFGFFQPTFTESEQGQGYALSVGYLKRPRTGVVALAFTVNQELLGTTSKFKYSYFIAVQPFDYVNSHLNSNG